MSEKRRDSKGRVLRNGEVQRSDGKYMFRYTDTDGIRRTIYSWKLVSTDKVPDGKQCCDDLRSMEKKVLRDVEDGIHVDEASRLSINELFDRFMRLRTELRESTRSHYLVMYNAHVRKDFGKRKIVNVRYSDVYKLYMDLSSSKSLKVSTIQQIHIILHQVFDMALKDNVIRSNPTSQAMADISRRLNESVEKRHALTLDQQSELLDYVYGNPRFRQYGPMITVLLGTGMRIGELAGLRWDDIDLDNGIISVNHALSYKAGEDGKCRYRISSPKTQSSIRIIPILSDVRKAIEAEMERQRIMSEDMEIEPFEVDGYSGFIFLTARGKPYSPSYAQEVVKTIVESYNRFETARAKRFRRAPVYLPKISPHIFRHTFCTRLCENEPNIKVIQEVMGHKDITTTMNVYSEATQQAKLLSFENLEGKIKLA